MRELDELFIKHSGSDLIVKRDVPLAQYTSFKIGGRAGVFIEPRTTDALLRCLRIFYNNGARPYILGGGTNVLITDKGLPYVLSTNGLKWLEDDGNGTITAGAGYSLRNLVSYAIRNCLEGLERITGIPGNIGGAVMMNAGKKQYSIGQKVKRILLATPYGKAWLNKGQMTWKYRCLSFKSTIYGSSETEKGLYVIAGAELKLSKKRDNKALKDYFLCDIKKRRATQPVGKLSAGCIFKNPEPAPAGRLIEECGLKGYQYGGAMVSKKHANFIINHKGASADDVVYIMKHIQECVFKRFSIRLEPEIRLMGISLN